eukprot:PhF_6_TR35151/c0_g1_i1/m.51222
MPDAPAGNDPTDAKCTCKKEHIGVILSVSGVVASFFVGLLSVLSLLASPEFMTAILNIYILVLSAVSFVAELRAVGKIVRTMTFPLLKWFYFVTVYTGRGMFYIFIGSLLLDNEFQKVFSNMIGGITMGIGLAHILAKIFTPQYCLPSVLDPGMEYEDTAKNGKDTNYQPPSLAAHVIASQTGVSASTAQKGLDVHEKVTK